MEIKKFLMKELDFKKINKGLNKGIYETKCLRGTAISFGCSYESINGNLIYIYNIFLGSEYIGISAYGTPQCPIPNAVAIEMTGILANLGCL